MRKCDFGVEKEILKKKIYYFACMDVLPACMSMYHMYAVSLEDRRVSDPLGLEIQTVVSCHVLAGY